MANLRDIRRRISSVKNTAQITKAMQLVSAAKMKKAQDQALSGRFYSYFLNKILNNVKEKTNEPKHPLLSKKEANKDLFVVITSNKGLCGPLNTNVIKLILKEDFKNIDFVTIGSKGKATLSKLNANIIADFDIKDPVEFSESKQISKYLTDKFIASKYNNIKIVFTNFINTLKHDSMVETLLPVRLIDLGNMKGFEGVGKKDEENNDEFKASEFNEYIFEPNPDEVLDLIVYQYVNYQLYQMILESRASEHSSRMVSMKSATDNADQMISDLTLEYNKQRQASITAELLEITSAMSSLQ